MTESRRPYVIAEAGVNHNGSLDIARHLVDAAAEAGADAVKFQTFRPEALVRDDAPKANYQRRSDGGGSQLQMLKRLVLDEEAHRRLAEHCGERGIEFLSTAFDADSADFLAGGMHLPRFKIPSGEITNGPLLLHIARFGRPIILSTGMSDLAEVEQALQVIAFGYLEPDTLPSWPRMRDRYASDAAQAILRERVTLLHCTTEYPCPVEAVNLRAMSTLAERFGLPVGYSDHTEGISAAIAATALGATVIEKHFTVDRNLPGPDHQASLEPEELAEMVRQIHWTAQALGNGEKRPAAAELGNRAVARKSIVASRPIRAGEAFSADNLTAKRPAGGRSPMDYWALLGQTANRDYQTDETID